MSDYSDLELQEQLMNQLEEMQTEIDQYKQTISNLQSEVSKKDSLLLEVLDKAELMSQQSANLSELQELTSTVQTQSKKIREQSETIKFLNDRIGKLAESDNVLKINEELKKQNELLKQEKLRAEQEAEAMTLSVKREYDKKSQRLAETQAEANKAKADAEATRNRQNELVNKKAKEMYQSKEKSLISAYKSKEMALAGVFFGSLAYGVLVTLFTAIRSETFVSDFKSFLGVIWGFILKCVELVQNGADFVAQLGDKIPQPIVATIVHWILWLVVIGGVGIGAVILCLIGVAKIYTFYAEDYADTLSLVFALISLALSIFFAEEIRTFVPVNILLLLIITHVLYVGVRWYIKGWRASRGYY